MKTVISHFTKGENRLKRAANRSKTGMLHFDSIPVFYRIAIGNEGETVSDVLFRDISKLTYKRPNDSRKAFWLV